MVRLEDSANPTGSLSKRNLVRITVRAPLNQIAAVLLVAVPLSLIGYFIFGVLFGPWRSHAAGSASAVNSILPKDVQLPASIKSAEAVVRQGPRHYRMLLRARFEEEAWLADFIETRHFFPSNDTFKTVDDEPWFNDFVNDDCRVYYSNRKTFEGLAIDAKQQTIWYRYDAY